MVLATSLKNSMARDIGIYDILKTGCIKRQCSCLCDAEGVV